MSLDLVTFSAFVSCSMLALGLGMVARALFFQGTAVPVRVGGLRRTSNVYDRPPSSGFFGRIDQGFDRLVLESGLGLSPLTGFMWLALGAIIAGGVSLLLTDDPLIGTAGGLGGLCVFLAAFAIMRARRIALIKEQLPHVLDMLARSTRAGRSVEQAIAIVGEEAKGILGKEFHHCSAQLEMGRAFDRVLKSMSHRVPIVEFRILTTTLIIQRRTGGHLSDTLERMASVIRDRLAANRQVRAATGGGRISTLVVAAIAPLAFLAIFILHREHLSLLFTDPMGRTLLWIGVILEIVGLLWVYLLLKKDS